MINSSGTIVPTDLHCFNCFALAQADGAAAVFF